MRKDVEFLRSHNLMDYSLLLAIETENKQAPDSTDQDRATNRLKQLSRDTDRRSSAKEFSSIDVGEIFAESHRFKEGYKVFHVSIIDYLQEWNFSKKTERFAKTLLLNKDGDMLSAIEPNRYATRFRQFMDSNVFV